MKTRWFIIFIFMALVSLAGLFIPESDTLYNVVDKNINYADTSWTGCFIFLRWYG